ncbi:putative ABC transporter-binding protein precursor [Marinibacterium anthonyi]|nr:putative ABC transporter-binding protein precursor [Marinibacterium anthonyi]
MTRHFLTTTAILLIAGAARANCPAVTLADDMGVAPGAFPQQYDLAEFETAAGCEMEFSENPEMADLNRTIQGNPDLPPLADRLPEEPLVIVPYDAIGTYGGTFDALSNATEAGTSDFLSVRHVNLVRYSDDLETIVPNVAKSWEWNDDFTELTITLRKGHKWSDGEPFTSEDVRFYFENLALDPNIIEKPKDYVLAGGEPIQVEVIDDQIFKLKLAAPKPGLLAHFATSYAQPFQPAHYLGQFHPALTPDADAKAKEYGYESGYDLINAYYGASDWTDTPTPMLRDPEKAAQLPFGTQPTLESHIYVSDTTEGRKLVANPYFFQVDTTGQQLPYISRQDELFKNDNEVRVLALVNGEVDYKAQSLQLPSAPILLENQEKGGYTIQLKPTIALPAFSFNVTSTDETKRAVFNTIDFRKAMSLAINRDELNEIAFFGLGTPQTYLGFSPIPDFAAEFTDAGTAFDADQAKAMLDEIGVVDADGDGFRDLPDGQKITLNLQFSTQGIGGEVVELVAQYWADVGMNTTVKEVTPDEYRAAQSANELDVQIWQQGTPVAIALGSSERFVPPYGSYFDHRVGMGWAEWIDSDGASGIEPPQYAKDMIDDIDAFQQAIPGSPEAAGIGKRIAKNFADNMLFIGTVNAPAPIYVRNGLKNVPEFKTWSYEYYRTYPYRPTQWFLAEDN